MRELLAAGTSRVLTKLAKQYNTSPRIGGLIHIYQATAIVYAPLTLLGVMTTVYGLWGQPLIQKLLPGFTIYHLMACMVGFILMLMLFFYKVIIPSTMAFAVQQQYKHRNPLVADMRKSLAVLDRIEKKMNSIEHRLDELEKQNNNRNNSQKNGTGGR